MSSEIDCTGCGNCCRFMGPPVTEDGLVELSRAEKISPEQFREKYLEQNEFGEWSIRQTPCPFLEENRIRA